jgi:hypothetical protein
MFYSNFSFLFLFKSVAAGWPSVQLIFGLLFTTICVWSEPFPLYVIVILLLAGFIFLSSEYSITKGIYDST